MHRKSFRGESVSSVKLRPLVGLELQLIPLLFWLEDTRLLVEALKVFEELVDVRLWLEVWETFVLLETDVLFVQQLLCLNFKADFLLTCIRIYNNLTNFCKPSTLLSIFIPDNFGKLELIELNNIFIQLYNVCKSQVLSFHDTIDLCIYNAKKLLE